MTISWAVKQMDKHIRAKANIYIGREVVSPKSPNLQDWSYLGIETNWLFFFFFFSPTEKSGFFLEFPYSREQEQTLTAGFFLLFPQMKTQLRWGGAH